MNGVHQDQFHSERAKARREVDGLILFLTAAWAVYGLILLIVEINVLVTM